MPTRDEIVAELQRRADAGEFNEQQQTAFTELRRRGVIPEAGPQARVPDYLENMLGQSGIPESDVTRLTQTGLTPGTVPEFAAAHVQDLRRRGIDPSTQKQVAIQDLYRQQAGQKPRTAGRDFFAETQDARAQTREQNIVGRFRNAGLNVLSNLGETAYNAVGTVAPGYANKLGDEYETLLNPNRESKSGFAGQTFAELAKLATFARTGPRGMAAIYGAQGAGGTRRRVEELRSQGEDISGLEEFGTAAGVGAVEAASGFVGGKIFQSMGRTMQQASPTLRSLIGNGDPGAIRSFITQSLTLSGHALAEGSEEAVTQVVTNFIQQGIDPELAISEGIMQAFQMGALLSPFGAAGAQGTLRTQAGQEQRQAEQTLPESTPQAVPPRTPLEQRLTGQEGTTPAQTPLEQQLTGQQATDPTPQERDQFFGTGVSDPTLTEEQFLWGRREDPLDEGVTPPQTPQEGRLVGQPTDAPNPPPDLNEVQFRRWYQRNVDPTAGVTDLTEAWNRYIPRRTATPQRPRRLTDLPARVSATDLSYLIAEQTPLEAAEGQARLEEQDAERAYFAAELAKVRGADEGFELVHLPLDQVQSDEAADASAVDQYAAQPGRTAPPIVAGRVGDSDQLSVVDGKHRVAAAKARGEKSVAAYVPRADAQRFPGRMTREGEIPVRRTTEPDVPLPNARRADEGMQETAKAPVANEKIKAVAQEYGQQRGTDVSHTPGQLSPLSARRLARAYEDVEHDPGDGRVSASYEAFNRETLDQFNDLKAKGYVFEPWDNEGQPYADVAEMAQDLAENRHLYFFKTEGTTTEMPDDHPMKQTAPGTGGLLYNDVFRAVHDVYGHAKDGYGFDIEGEENAWRSHSQMYSDLSRGAMTTETRGQSTWVGYGPHGRSNRKAIEDGRKGDIQFAPQKAGLLPDEFWSAEGLRDVEPDILPAAPKKRQKLLGTLRSGRQAAAQATPVEGTEHTRRVPRAIEDWITPISSRVRDLSASVFNRLMRMEFDTSVHRERLKKELHSPAARITQALGGKRSPEYRKFKRALLNGDREAAEALLPAETHTDLDMFFTTFRILFDNMRDAGVTIGDLGENYWARYVKDYKSFKKVFGDDTGVFEEAWDLARATKGRRLLTAKKKAEIANSVIQGYGPRKPGSMGIANARQRTVDAIPDDALDYYIDPLESAFRYIDGATYAAERSRFLGRNARDPEQIAESVGAIVQSEVDAGNLSQDAQSELHDLLTTRFTADLMQTEKWVRNFKQLVYISTLGQFRSTLTQLTDAAFTSVTHGPAAGLRGAKAGMRLTAREKRLVMEDIGVHDHGEEFKDVGRIAKATDWVLRRTGLKSMDRFGKETRINGAWEAMKTAAGNPTSETARRLRRDYAPVLGEEQFNQAMKDLRDGKKTENIKYILFLDIAKIQPVVTSQMPKKYLDMPNGRIVYTLKTFTMMQLDFVRRDVVRKLATPGQRREGLRNLGRYIVMFGLLDLGVDMLKDLLKGRAPAVDDIPDRAVDSTLAMVGLNRYTVEKAWTSPSDAAINFLAPPLSWIDAPFTDLTSETKGLRTVRQVPIIGELLYYWAPFGRGWELTQDESKRDYRAKLRDLRTEAEDAYRDGDSDLVRKLLTIYNERRRQGPGDGRKTPLGVSDLRRRTTTEENPQ